MRTLCSAMFLLCLLAGRQSSGESVKQPRSMTGLHNRAVQILSDARVAKIRGVLTYERNLMQGGIHRDPTSGEEYFTGYSYGTIFDWDSYFETLVQLYMGMGAEKSETAVLMFLNRQQPSGFIPRDIPTSSAYPQEGEEHAKPFLAQIALLDSIVSGSNAWLDDNHFRRIGRAIDYWLNEMDSNHDGLSEWMSGPHSGMDTQRERAGLWGARISEGVDLNSYLVREMRAYAALANLRGKTQVASMYAKRADQLRDRMRATMWDEQDGWYYDLNVATGKPIRVKSVASFAVLWAGIATPEQARRMIYEHLLNAREFWSPFPVPALARSEPGYSEPELPGDVGSGWRANTWIPTNYMLFHGLRTYGYEEIAHAIAYRTEKLMNDSGDCEYYGSESGTCMGQHPFWGWSLLGHFIEFEDGSNLNIGGLGLR
jgi:putative isomerase